MREIWTEKNTSVFGRENMFFFDSVPYPKPIQPPTPIEQTEIVLEKKPVGGYYHYASQDTDMRNIQEWFYGYSNSGIAHWNY